MSAIKVFCKGKNFKKDKGYAWVILLLSVISHILHIGFGLSVVGNITIAHKHLFGIDVEQSGLISTVNVAATFVFGPIASLLVKKFGCRITAMFGGTCMVLGFGLSSLSTQPWHAFLLYGALAGIGIPSLLVSTSEILSMHFDKYKYLAFSMAILGQFIGASMWPVVSQLLLDVYHYSTTMLILASFHVLNIVIGCLLVEPAGAESEVLEAAIDIKEYDNTQEAKGHDNLAMTISETQINIQVPQKNEVQDQDAGYKANQPDDTALESLKILLRSFPIWILLINGFCWGANGNSFFVYVNDFIVHKLDVTADEAALGITILGIANICGTLAVVFTSSLKFDRALLHTCCEGVYGICTIVIAFSVNKTMFYILCAIWGFGFGGSIANLLGHISAFCEPKHLALLFGLSLMSEGIAVVTATPLIGYVTKQVGAEYGIILSGCFGVAGALFMLPVVILRMCRRSEDTIC